MYMLKTEDARHLHFHTSGFNVEVETASQFALEGTVTEVPISYRERIGKQKLSTWRDGISIMSSVFRLARDYNPAFLLRGALILNLTFSSNRRGPKILRFREASFRGSDYRRNAFSTNETDGNQDFEENPRESRLTTRFFNILKSRCTGNSGQSSIRRTQITEVIS